MREILYSECWLNKARSLFRVNAMRDIRGVRLDHLAGLWRSRRARIRRAAFLLAMAIFASMPFIAFAKEDSAQIRFEREAVAGWERIEKSMEPIVGSVIVTAESHGRGNASVCRSVSKTKVWIIRGAEKLQEDLYDGRGKWLERTVICINPDYSFAVRQDIQAGPFRIMAFGRTHPMIDNIRSAIDALGLSWFRSPYGIESDIRPLPKILKSKYFRLIRCSDIQINGRQLVEVEFAFKQDESEHSGMFSSNGEDQSSRMATVLLDPAADWRVVRSTTKRKGGESRMELIYNQKSGVPGDVANTQVSIIESQETSETRFDYSPFLYQNTAINEFYLPTFGLAESNVPQLSSSSNRAWQWILIALNVIVIAILVVVYRRRRR